MAGLAVRPGRWVSEGRGGGGGRRNSLVRRLSSLANYKILQTAAGAGATGDTAGAMEDAKPPAQDGSDGGSDWWLAQAGGGRQDSWTDRLSSSVIAQRLSFLNTNKDNVARSVGMRVGAGRPANESPAPAPRSASVVTRAVRRLSMRRSQ
jgi:hypothetical protein